MGRTKDSGNLASPKSGILLNVRPITADEVTAFSLFAACEDRGFAPANATQFEQWLQDLWAKGRSSPERCWVAERGDRYTAAAVYWRKENRYHIEHYHPSDDGSRDERELLARSIHDIRITGGSGVWAEIVSPPMSELDAASFAARLNEMGFIRTRHRLRFRRPALADDVPDAKLAYRTCADLGRTAYIEAWAQVSAESLDHDIAKAQNEGSAPANAATAFANAQGTQNGSRHWEVAYLPDGALVGLVAPGLVQNEPVIHFYGVVPAFRRKGFGRQMLIRGIRSLAASGAESVRLDVDAANEPSVRTIRACGFQQVRSYSWYDLILSP